MRLPGSRSDKRSWSRRLVDDETRTFVEEVLEETSEVFRTASGEFQLRGVCADAFAGGHTTDLRWLKERGVDAETFYARELAPSWEGLDQAARAAKIDSFVELSHAMGTLDPSGHPPETLVDLVATVHVKVILLAWAYDRTYSYMDRLFNGPLQYRAHRYRLAGGWLRRSRDGSSPTLT
jgi:hypothetical protein